MERLKSAGAKRVIRLAVSIAAHSALMEPAVPAFAEAVERAGIGQAHLPVIGNVEAHALRAPSELSADVKAQLTSRVRWTESVRRMVADGTTAFAEIGSGEVLIGMIRRIDPSPALTALDRPASLDAYLA
jgi:[acyl-carrier-protein] S-malonyltransferase